jgi:hypothetical protein
MDVVQKKRFGGGAFCKPLILMDMFVSKTIEEWECFVRAARSKKEKSGTVVPLFRGKIYPSSSVPDK